MHATPAELEAGLDHVRAAPHDVGTLELVVARPALGERAVLAAAELDLATGLVGDTWDQRPSTRSADGGPHPDMQLNVMSARAAQLIARSPKRWPLAGDQLYVDLDLSTANLPAGTVLSIGEAGTQIVVTDQPHNGCAKFSARFGPDALRFVNSSANAGLRLRGINARVLVPGPIRQGDVVRKR